MGMTPFNCGDCLPATGALAWVAAAGQNAYHATRNCASTSAPYNCPPYQSVKVGGSGCLAPTGSYVTPAPPATCPEKSHLDGKRDQSVSMASLVGCLLTGAVAFYISFYMTQPPAHVEDSEGMFWWAHLFIAGITVILTTLALATKEIYKYTVTVNKQNYPMFDIVVYINYWK